MAQGLLGVLWQVSGIVGWPPGHWSTQEVGGGSQVLVSFIGLGVPGWGVGLGVDLGPMILPTGDRLLPYKDPL